MIPVPNGLRPDIAVLTEPMAIGYHAVNRSEITTQRCRSGHRMRSGRPGDHLPAQDQRYRDHHRQRLFTRPVGPWPPPAVRRWLLILRPPRPTQELGKLGHTTSIAENAALGLKAMKDLHKLPASVARDVRPFEQARRHRA